MRACLRLRGKRDRSKQLAEEISGAQILTLDATDEGAPSKVFSALRPDIVVLCAGVFPPAAPLHEQSWQEFAVNWEADVKIAFHFCKAALTQPLPKGTAVILISSGAALAGSPLTGGYAGAKRTQLFITNYSQKESGSPWAGLTVHGTCPAHDARHRARKACGQGLFQLSKYPRPIHQKHGPASCPDRCRGSSHCAGKVSLSLQGERRLNRLVGRVLGGRRTVTRLSRIIVSKVAYHVNVSGEIYRIQNELRSNRSTTLSASPSRSAANSNCTATACLAPCTKPRTPCKRAISVPGAASPASTDAGRFAPGSTGSQPMHASMRLRPAGMRSVFCQTSTLPLPRRCRMARRQRTCRGSSLSRTLDWDGVAVDTANPEALYDSREATQLAFVAVIQQLPPRQRATLLLCDVLGHKLINRLLLSGEQ